MVETPKALRLLAHTPGPSLLRSEHLSPEATTLPELLRGGAFHPRAVEGAAQVGLEARRPVLPIRHSGSTGCTDRALVWETSGPPPTAPRERPRPWCW